MAGEKEILQSEEVLQETGGAGDGAEFWNQYKTYILAAVGILVVAVGYFAWTSMNGGKNETAENAAYNAVYYWEKDSLKKALDGDGASSGLLSVADEYGSTNVGNQAKYMAGIALLKQGKTEEGIKMLESFSKGDNLVSAAAYMALAFAQEDLGKEAEAAELFEKAANVSTEKDDQMRPFILKHAGEAYEAAGNKAKALEVYKSIKEKYPLSTEAASIDKYIGRAE